MERIYLGNLNASGDLLDDNTVTVREGGESRPLDARLELRNHSPTGFAWGYGGSGPAQLALAILCDALDERTDLDPAMSLHGRCLNDGEVLALRLYQQFRVEIVSCWAQESPWTITRGQVLRWVDLAQRREAPPRHDADFDIRR